VPFIGSRHDRAALGLARRMMRQAGAEVTVLHVTSDLGGSGARAQVDALFPSEEGGVRLKVVRHDAPDEAALEEARHGYDLVVVGVGAQWGLEDRLFGLHRERIIRDAPGSLLVVRHPEPAPAAEATGEARDSERAMPARG
jgi:nucleotide-binding universal stress UspA family protein